MNSQSSWKSSNSSSLRSSSALEVQRKYAGTWRSFKPETPFKLSQINNFGKQTYKQIQNQTVMERQPSIQTKAEVSLCKASRHRNSNGFPCMRCSLITKHKIATNTSQFYNHFRNGTSSVGPYPHHRNLMELRVCDARKTDSADGMPIRFK